MKVKGRVHSVGQTRQVSEKFQTREIVIVTDDKFPQYIPCQLSQDKVSLADNLKIGEAVEASYNLRGREWKSPQGEVRYFLTLEIWTMLLTTISEAPVVNTNTDGLPW
jgi:hypothetical protein